MGRRLAIGDIHGCDVALSTLLNGLHLTHDDTVILLGDLIDRGPQSRAVIDRLIQLQQQVTLIGICGHTGQSSGVPAFSDGYVCIDTKACGGLWLTCLDPENEFVRQASQAGEFRGPFPLHEFGTNCGPQHG